MSRVSFLHVFALALTPSIAYAQKGEPLPTKKAIFESWGNLDKHLKSLVMTVRCKEHHTGHVSDDMKQELEARRKQAEKERGVPNGLPPGDYRPVTVEAKYVFTWAPGAMRLDRTGHVYGFETRTVTKRDYAIVHEGDRATSFFDSGERKRHATVDTNDRLVQMEHALTGPNCHLLFGVNTKHSSGFPTSSFEFDWLDGVSGEPAVRGLTKDPRNQNEANYTFLPRRRFAVAEFFKRSPGGWKIHYKAEFDDKLPVPFIPRTWQVNHFDGEKLSISRTYTVESLRRDEPLPANAFVIDYPAGTEVRDMTVTPHKVYTVPAKP